MTCQGVCFYRFREYYRAERCSIMIAMNEESKRMLTEIFQFFDELQKKDWNNIAVSPVSSLPYSKEKIKEIIKERVHYKNQEGHDYKNERFLLENNYANLAHFVQDSEAVFLNKVFSSLPENYRSLELTDENFESEFHKVMSKEDFKRYQLGIIGKNAGRIMLWDEIRDFEKDPVVGS